MDFCDNRSAQKLYTDSEEKMSTVTATKPKCQMVERN